MSVECSERLKKYRDVKIVVVGDGTVGKTCLLHTLAEDAFPFEFEYLPTVYDTHTQTMKLDGVDFLLTLWDTAGQEEYTNFRPLSYPKTDCFILCYDINNRSSFVNIKDIWIPELRRYCPKTAVILVGTKSELRQTTEPTKNTVSEIEGKKMKAQIKANGFLQCSAKTKHNLESVFVEAVRAIARKPNHRKMRCNFL